MSAQLNQLPMSQPTVSQAQVVQAYFPTESDWKLMLNWGASALKSGMLPSAVKSAEAAAVIVLKGRELGISFMQAVAHIHVISGKPSCSAEMQQALARRNLPGLRIDPIECSDLKAEIEFCRPEKGSKPYRHSFSMEDAKRAELLNKENWRKYPKAMLWSRAISGGLKIVCPEALMGMSHTPDELGAVTDQDGNVIETTGRTVEKTFQNESENNESAAESPIKPVSEQPVHPMTQDRADLYRRLMAIYQDFKAVCPDVRAELFKLYKVEETKLLTVEELRHFVAYVEKYLVETAPMLVK